MTKHREWTEYEDTAVLEDRPIKEIAAKIGRSYSSVANRRHRLHDKPRRKYLPRLKAAEALVAKTCLGCGQLKMAHEYGMQSTGTSHHSKCKSCRNEYLRDKRIEDQEFAELSLESARRIQSETLPHAKNHGKEWTGPELELLARPELSASEIAKVIGRTLYAVKSQRNLRAKHKWEVML